MNLKQLFKIIPNRIVAIREVENFVYPQIRAFPIYDEPVEFNDLFRNPNCVITDLLFLSDIWNDLIPDKGMSINQKYCKIADWIAGKRNANDFLIMMELLSKGLLAVPYKERDCAKCKHYSKSNQQYPCSHCCNCYTDKFEQTDGE